MILIRRIKVSFGGIFFEEWEYPKVVGELEN